MKVIIAGTRTFKDQRQFDAVMLDFLTESGISEIVSGGCRGPDVMGEVWAHEHSIPVKRFLPDWALGRKAGPLRNARMADYADMAIVFWDGSSRGTKSMIELMKSAGKPCQVVFYGAKP